MAGTTKQPLNGAKTHPLSAHALSELRYLLKGPQPRQSFNAGVSDRLEREALVELVSLPSPFKSHKGKNIPFLQITDAGRARIAEG
jgi:hypothetical protein